MINNSIIINVYNYHVNSIAIEHFHEYKQLERTCGIKENFEARIIDCTSTISLLKTFSPIRKLKEIPKC